MKRLTISTVVIALLASGVSLFVDLSASHPSTDTITLDCSDSVGQQGSGGEKVIGGVEGLVLPGSGDPAGLRLLRSSSGRRYFVYKAFLAVSSLAAPAATVSIVRPQSARLLYGSSNDIGTLVNDHHGSGFIAASRSRVRLPVCGPNFTGFVGGVVVLRPTSVTFAVSSKHLKTERVTVSVGNG